MHHFQILSRLFFRLNPEQDLRVLGGVSAGSGADITELDMHLLLIPRERMSIFISRWFSFREV